MDTTSSIQILLVEDDPDYRRSLRSLLELENYSIDDTASKEDAIQNIKEKEYAIALVDLRLKDNNDIYDLSGFEVAKKARDAGVPCLIITAFETVDTTRLALRSRDEKPLAKDVIPKTSGPQAVLDAIKVIITSKEEEQEKHQPELKIDLEKKLVWYKEDEVKLSRNQYALLAHLYRYEGKVCSSKDLLKAVYDETIPVDRANSDRRLERLVERVREKIEENPAAPKHLTKVYGGRGYLLKQLSKQ
jgi:DNA-binding response OmpR family regulator